MRDFNKIIEFNDPTEEEVKKSMDYSFSIVSDPDTWDTSEVKTCRHGYVFIDQCVECMGWLIKYDV